MLDKDGYPDEKTLKKIESFDISKDSVIDLISLLEEHWIWASYIACKGKKIIRLELHTGGWSGHEDMINALQKSSFWICFWEKSIRGGHYYFRIKI